jgi:hypothetical protein
MAARLGDVLYWIGCGFAGLFLLGTLFAVGIIVTGYSTDPSSTIIAGVFSAVAAVLCWAIGKAFRYIIAGIEISNR